MNDAYPSSLQLLLGKEAPGGIHSAALRACSALELMDCYLRKKDLEVSCNDGLYLSSLMAEAE